MTTLHELEATYCALRDAYDNSDINYRDWVRETPLDEFLAEVDHCLMLRPELEVGFLVAWHVWPIYAAAKVLQIYRDEGRIAAITWKLVEGEAA